MEKMTKGDSAPVQPRPQSHPLIISLAHGQAPLLETFPNHHRFPES